MPERLPTVSEFTPSVQLMAVTLLLPVVESFASTEPITGECTNHPFWPSGLAKVTFTMGAVLSEITV